MMMEIMTIIMAVIMLVSFRSVVTVFFRVQKLVMMAPEIVIH